MKTVKVFIEMSEYGYSAYMEETSLDYGCIGEGRTVGEAVEDFYGGYEEIKKYYKETGKTFEEAHFEFFYDTASFLEYYSRAFSLAGLERITGINQTQLGHYLHGRRKPSRKTIDKIQAGVHNFANNLLAVNFA